jgi:hypothetical protein
MTNHEKLIKAGDILIDVVKDAQARYSQALDTIHIKPATDLTKEQREEFLKNRNQAMYDIIVYKELLGMCYKVISAPDSAER